MLQLIKNWLKGSKEYFTGVVIYRKVAEGNDRLLELFTHPPTEFSRKKLLDALTTVYAKMKAQEILSSEDTGLVVRRVILKQPDLVDEPTTPVPGTVPELPNPDLYAACKKEADELFKEVMNLRAELFSLARANDFTDVNTPDRIEGRRKLALNVVTGYQEVSKLYDRADYVKIHGRLPDEPGPDQDDPLDQIPDALVKSSLDNLRKNYNKIKRRPQTAERIALMQKHETNIKKLEDRWLLLKPKK